jgi:VWFA-related protein
MNLRVLIAAALLIASCTFAQQAPTVPEQASTAARSAESERSVDSATFKARTQLVLVPVVVTDKGGKHIAGLTKDAFRLEEDGKARDVALFENVVPGSAMNTDARPATSLASNFSADGVHPRHFSIVVLDMINTPFLKQTEGRRQLIEFLSKGLPPDEPMTLLGLGSKGIVQLHSFTTDTKALIAALQKLQGSVTSTEMAVSEAQRQTEDNDALMNSADEQAQQISQFLQDAIDTMAMMQQQDSTWRTLDALNQIAQAYAGDRARKTLIWASAGFPFMLNDPRAFAHMGTDMVQQYERTWRALTAANIAVYPVEVIGLDSRMVDVTRKNPSIQLTRSRHGNPMGTSNALPYDDSFQRQESLRAFADATGGRPCINTNDFKKCFAEAVEDSQSYYLLGYYLPSSDSKPGWRKLKVKLTVPDAHARSREGFYVTPPPNDSPAARREEVVTALAAPFEYTGIVLDVRSTATKPLEPKPDTPAQAERKVMQEFLVHIPSSSLAIDTENKNRVNLEIAAVALNRSGKDVSKFSQNVKAFFNPEMLARISKTGVALQEKLELIPGKYECRFVVRDNQSGQIGTVHMVIDVK